MIYPLSSTNPTTTNCVNWLGANLANVLQICIGTGSTAFTPSSYSLTAQYACNYTTSASYDGAGNLYITTNILLSTGATISEAGIILTLPDTCINYNPSGSGSCGSYTTASTMWIATTFTGVAVGSGSSIGVTFQISG